LSAGLSLQAVSTTAPKAALMKNTVFIFIPFVSPDRSSCSAEHMDIKHDYARLMLSII
jgi:hypothetical protein